jgi:hypothetical protein
MGTLSPSALADARRVLDGVARRLGREARPDRESVRAASSHPVTSGSP